MLLFHMFFSVGEASFNPHLLVTTNGPSSSLLPVLFLLHTFQLDNVRISPAGEWAFFGIHLWKPFLRQADKGHPTTTQVIIQLFISSIIYNRGLEKYPLFYIWTLKRRSGERYHYERKWYATKPCFIFSKTPSQIFSWLWFCSALVLVPRAATMYVWIVTLRPERGSNLILILNSRILLARIKGLPNIGIQYFCQNYQQLVMSVLCLLKAISWCLLVMHQEKLLLIPRRLQWKVHHSKAGIKPFRKRGMGTI